MNRKIKENLLFIILVVFSVVTVLGNSFEQARASGGLLSPSRPSGLLSPLDLSSIDIIGNSLTSNSTGTIAGNFFVTGSTTISGNLILTGSFNKILSATSINIGGSLLSGGACSFATTSVPGATFGMVVSVTPATTTEVGTSTFWKAYVSTSGVVTTQICESATGTPVATPYNIRVML